MIPRENGATRLGWIAPGAPSTEHVLRGHACFDALLLSPPPPPPPPHPPPPPRPRRPRRCDEREIRGSGKQARAMRATEQLGHRATAGRAIVHGVRVHVHPDELVRARRVEAPTVGLRVREGVRSVRETVLDARLQVPRDVLHEGGAKVSAYYVAAEREGQPGLPMPPFAQVGPEVESSVGIGELSLVDQEPRVGPAGGHIILDLVERDYDVAGGGLVQFEREERGRELPRHGDEGRIAERGARVGRPRSAGDDPRSVTVTEARPVRE